MGQDSDSDEERPRRETVLSELSYDGMVALMVTLPILLNQSQPHDEHYAFSACKEPTSILKTLRGATPANKDDFNAISYKNRRLRITIGNTRVHKYECDTITRQRLYGRDLDGLRPFAISQRYRYKAKRHSSVAHIVAQHHRREVLEESFSDRPCVDTKQRPVCMLAKEMRWIVDSGAGYHLVSSNGAGPNDMIKQSENSLTVATANGATSVEKSWAGHIGDLQCTIEAGVLENSSCSLLSMGRLVMHHGFDFEWKKGGTPILRSERGKIIQLDVDNFVPTLPISPCHMEANVATKHEEIRATTEPSLRHTNYPKEDDPHTKKNDFCDWKGHIIAGGRLPQEQRQSQRTSLPGHHGIYDDTLSV